jgi:uncharacterized membrane protein YhaH (DUF805 family)
MGFIRDQFTEEKDGKFSRKSFWGFVIMFLVCAAFALDGLHFYKANESLFNSMLIAGCTLLGLTAVGGMFGKKNASK